MIAHGSLLGRGAFGVLGLFKVRAVTLDQYWGSGLAPGAVESVSIAGVTSQRHIDPDSSSRVFFHQILDLDVWWFCRTSAARTRGCGSGLRRGKLSWSQRIRALDGVLLPAMPYKTARGLAAQTAPSCQFDYARGCSYISWMGTLLHMLRCSVENGEVIIRDIMLANQAGVILGSARRGLCRCRIRPARDAPKTPVSVVSS